MPQEEHHNTSLIVSAVQQCNKTVIILADDDNTYNVDKGLIYTHLQVTVFIFTVLLSHSRNHCFYSS